MTATPSATPQMSPSTMAMLGTLVVVLVSGFVVLTIVGRDTGSYALFVAGPVVSTVVGALLARRVHVVEQVARAVEHQTNGLASAAAASIHHHLDEQTTELLDAGPPAPAPAAGSRPAAG